MSIKSAIFGLAAALIAFASAPTSARADAPLPTGTQGITIGAVQDTTSMRCGCRRHYVRYRYYRPYVRNYRPYVRYYRVVRIRYV